ncbi:MAG: hypothetical protein PIR53_17250 [Nocardioides alkalitolerans]
MTMQPPATYGTPPSPPPGPVPSGRRRGAALPWVLVAVLTVVALLLGALLVLQTVGGDDEEGRGFASPEEAIEFSTESLADGDAEAALSAWSAGEQARGSDFVGSLEYLEAYAPYNPNILPGDDDFFAGLGVVAREGGAADQIRRLTYSLLVPDLSQDQVTPLSDDAPSAQELRDDLDSGRLAGLTAQRIERLEGPERLAENYERAAELVGADERREYLVLYAWEGETYLGAVGVLRYDDEWSIDAFSAPIANVSVGVVTPASEDEFDDALASVAELGD